MKLINRGRSKWIKIEKPSTDHKEINRFVISIFSLEKQERWRCKVNMKEKTTTVLFVPARPCLSSSMGSTPPWLMVFLPLHSFRLSLSSVQAEALPASQAAEDRAAGRGWLLWWSLGGGGVTGAPDWPLQTRIVHRDKHWEQKSNNVCLTMCQLPVDFSAGQAEPSDGNETLCGSGVDPTHLVHSHQGSLKTRGAKADCRSTAASVSPHYFVGFLLDDWLLSFPRLDPTASSTTRQKRGRRKTASERVDKHRCRRKEQLDVPLTTAGNQFINKGFFFIRFITKLL